MKLSQIHTDDALAESTLDAIKSYLGNAIESSKTETVDPKYSKELLTQANQLAYILDPESDENEFADWVEDFKMKGTHSKDLLNDMDWWNRLFKLTYIIDKAEQKQLYSKATAKFQPKINNPQQAAADLRQRLAQRNLGEGALDRLRMMLSGAKTRHSLQLADMLKSPEQTAELLRRETKRKKQTRLAKLAINLAITEFVENYRDYIEAKGEEFPDFLKSATTWLKTTANVATLKLPTDHIKVRRQIDVSRQYHQTAQRLYDATANVPGTDKFRATLKTRMELINKRYQELKKVRSPAKQDSSKRFKWSDSVTSPSGAGMSDSTAETTPFDMI